MEILHFLVIAATIKCDSELERAYKLYFLIFQVSITFGYSLRHLLIFFF